MLFSCVDHCSGHTVMQCLRLHSPAVVAAAWSTATRRKHCRLHIAHGLKENVAALPAADHVSSITVQPLGHTIPNAPGKKASVAIYNHLAQKYGGIITDEAAKEGIELYGEFVAEAREKPGSHPNIDILLDVVNKQQQLTIVVEAQ